VIDSADQPPTGTTARPFPDGFTHIGTVYSNFDHGLDTDVADRLAAEDGTAAEHCAWHFHGDVWREGTRWYNYIMRHQSHVATIEGDSCLDVIDQANDRFGRA
jgi:hypothetical protein